MKITICSPVPSSGEDLFKLLVGSAAQLASGNHHIEVQFTCHDDSQRRALLDDELELAVGGAYVVAREEPLYFHANSVTHSRCVNALFSAAQADIAVICDFDMAFTCKNWDEILIDLLIKEGIAFLGTPYSADAGFSFNLGHMTVFARKYQRKPNCMFIAYSPAQLKPLTLRICEFASTYDATSIPLKLISTPVESREYGLPVGAFLHVDTGSMIPGIIEQHGLKYRSLVRRVADYTVLRSVRLPGNYPPFLLPEEYFYGDTPFIVHLRKGSSKSAQTSDPYPRQAFVGDVNAWIDSIKK